MKKSLYILLLISTLFLSLVGCNSTQAPVTTPDDTAAGDNGSEPAFNTSITNYDIVDDSSTEGFTIKSKKYNYEDNNVVILSAENESQQNYTVTVNMIYYDDSGSKLKAETQTFEGFAADWQKYFLFKPDIPFASYEYTVTTEDYNGECYGNKFTIKYTGVSKSKGCPIDWNDYTKGLGNGIVGEFILRYDYSKYLDFWYTAIIFDNTGEIYNITKTAKEEGEEPNIDLAIRPFLSLGTKGNINIPDDLKGETTGILVLNKAEISLASVD